MHKANVLKLAEHIEGLSLGEYDQSLFSHLCRPRASPACIAGHAVWLSGRWDRTSGWEPAPTNIAREWLGLTMSEAYDLFSNEPDELASPTAQDAAATLRHFAETGVVDWRRAEQ